MPPLKNGLHRRILFKESQSPLKKPNRLNTSSEYVEQVG